MEKVWCGARNKTMKSANTVFVQDSQSNVILYLNIARNFTTLCGDIDIQLLSPNLGHNYRVLLTCIK
jgi:hypothetical protein